MGGGHKKLNSVMNNNGNSILNGVAVGLKYDENPNKRKMMNMSLGQVNRMNKEELRRSFYNE